MAALIAIANSMRVANRKAPLAGTSGALCSAGAGYDYITGIGTPVAASLVNILAAQWRGDSPEVTISRESSLCAARGEQNSKAHLRFGRRLKNLKSLSLRGLREVLIGATAF
jgi:hypothetical protein